MSDAGVEATQFLLDGLKKKVKEDKLTDAAAGQGRAARAADRNAARRCKNRWCWAATSRW